MTTISPPVALKDHCSIIHDDVLYVYSPNAFQILPLKQGGKWSQETNGVSVTGATCVKGGVDGDNTKPALYVVGGAANSSSSTYPGLQRYSIADKSWQTITPVVPVTQQRLLHGAAYMNASSTILLYAGSQDGYTGTSSETFLLEMYPPYRVQAYSSTAPPAVKPIVLTWSDTSVLMVGGSSTNTKMFTFDPGNGWKDLGLLLPNALPDSSIAQSALFTLDDNSKILQTFRMDDTPLSISTNVLLNPGGQPAVFGETVGGSVTTAGPSAAVTNAARVKRSIFLNNYPTYNATSSPSTTRNGFSLAQGSDGLLAFVGGDSSDSVEFFNQRDNGWVAPTQILGAQLATSSTSTASSTATSTNTQSTTLAPATTSAAAASSGSSDKMSQLTILGAILGGVCGLAAILIILLLWLRNVRRNRDKSESSRRKVDYPSDKRRSGDYSFEEQGLQPLSKAGQPMGRSPVPSAFVAEGDSTAMYGRPSEKTLIRRVSSESGARLRPDAAPATGPNGFGQHMFKRDKGPITISKPMLPDLGDYKERPSIELGKATPAVAAATAAAAAKLPARKASQRKTDEGWSRYFAAGKVETNSSRNNPNLSIAVPPTRGQRGAFWPGSGVPELSPARSSKFALRDSAGNELETHSVATASPSLESAAFGGKSNHLAVAEGRHARISNADSVTTDGSDEIIEDDYEDERVDPAFSSGIPASVQDVAWTPVGNTWSGPPQRPLRHHSTSVGASDFPPPSTSSNQTSHTSNSKESSIPSFPMPNSTIRPIRPSNESAFLSVTNVQHPTATQQHSNREQSGSDYFSYGRGQDNNQKSNDMSWLNLGTPHR